MRPLLRIERYLFHRGVRHHLLGEGMRLIHDDLVQLLRRDAGGSHDALDPGEMRALTVGAIGTFVVPAMAFLAAPGGRAFLLASSGIRRMGLFRRGRFHDRHPVVVELPTARDIPD